jgi:hypothetical protein
MVRVEQALGELPKAEHSAAMALVTRLDTHPSRIPRMLANIAARSAEGRARLYEDTAGADE